MEPDLGVEQSIVGTISIMVEAASLASMHWTLDAPAESGVWHNRMITINEAAVAVSISPRETSSVLVMCALDDIRLSVPSLKVRLQEMTMRPEPLGDGGAQVVATGPAHYLASEWDLTKRPPASPAAI